MKKKKAAKKKVVAKKKAAKKSITKKRLVRKAARRPAKRIKKTAKRRPAKKAGKRSGTTPRTSNRKPLDAARGKPVGTVTHFYTHIKVAIVRFAKPVRTGAALRFSGATTDFTERIDSMQYDHRPIVLAPKGKQVGIRVGKRVREGDKVYLAN